MAHKHSVRDTGAHYIIDQYTRQIKNDSVNKTTIVQFDHNSERLTFEMPLYVDGHAMTLCDLIEIHYINISTDGNSQNHGTYEVNDIKAEGEKAVFTWLISQECTQLAGSLNFFIVFKCTENGVTVYRWGTEIYKNLPISAGMDNGEAIVTEYPDILAQWKAQIFGAQDASVLAVEAAKETALAAIEAAGEAKKQSVLDSIPDEYEALSALADQNHRNKAGAIVLDAEGESIALNDASEYPLQNLKVFGKSTQAGTPTPNAPVDIVSVENPVVKAFGKNLLCATENRTPIMANGITFESKKGSSEFIFGGTQNGTSNASGFLVRSMTIFPGIYTLSVSGLNGNDYINVKKLSGEQYYLFTAATPKEPKTFVIDEVIDIGVEIVVYSASIYNNTKVTVQLECGSVATEYEPYIEAQTVETSHTLPGIPVSSGGNYTDENGQQWICDEVDLARGVYVQRCNEYAVTGGETVLKSSDRWQKDGMFSFYMRDLIPYGIDDADKISFCISTHGKPNLWEWGHLEGFNNVGIRKNIIHMSFGSDLVGINTDDSDEAKVEKIKAYLLAQYSNGTPVTVQYVLATPIETPLTEAEINAFRALRSNRPNTVILNDAGAHMAVSYVADTKTYIDNKIKELMEGVTE